ncbi:P-loop containing nucleoside triphosphate hydrolase protein [Infundibulicybe gibba]|nr:P-loop containing nucleoside triphosphate hydrolase protein [Infundibulicybe gibba]
MPRRATIHYVPLRSSLVNLPISIYGPLLERSIRPQSLAVHLTRVQSSSNAAVQVYVGWTGMASTSLLEKTFETIDIDPQYAQGLGLVQGDIVEIGLLHDLATAKSVATEPVSSDDWDIIEINASHVESTLLSQVRVAKVDQEIDVWVLGRTRVRLKVVNIDPPSKTNALLLTTNTEVSIAPKLHSNKSLPKQKQSQGAANEAPIISSAKAHNLRVLPPHAYIPPNLHPNHKERIAYVSPATLARIHPSYSTSDDSAIYPVTIVKLNPSGDEKKETQVSEQKKCDIFVGALGSVPPGHIVFANGLIDLEDWDIIRLTPDRPGETAKFVSSGELAPSLPEATDLLAGVDDLISKCIAFCKTKFILHSTNKQVPGVSGLLLTGRPGAGKTSIAKMVAQRLQNDPETLTYTLYIDVSRLADKPISVLKTQFGYWFAKAAWHRPTILILDGLDEISHTEAEGTDSFRTRHITELFLRQFSFAARTVGPNMWGIILIATAESSAALHPLLNGSHVFREVINIKPPDKDARREIMSRQTEALLLDGGIARDPDSPLNFTALATQTEGYSATDLKDFVARAIHQVASRSAETTLPPVLGYKDFVAAQVDFVPLSLRDVKLEKSDIAWSDIGGLYETRKILRETLEWPTKYGPIFKQSPLRLRSGLLLYGFPGCGKTLLASAVAKECGLNFISVKGPEILNKYIGASEKSVRDLFERASAAKPCVLFFDEFDSIAPKRGHDSTGVTDRVVNQMLTQMDGAEGLDGVYVLAATSRPDLIDGALLRPGRLDKSLLCGMPDVKERKDILKAVGRKVKLSPSVDFDEIAAATEGYTGADLQHSYPRIHRRKPIASNEEARDENPDIKYVVLGGPEEKKVKTKAEESALQTRVSCLFYFGRASYLSRTDFFCQPISSSKFIRQGSEPPAARNRIMWQLKRCEISVFFWWISDLVSASPRSRKKKSAEF